MKVKVLKGNIITHNGVSYNHSEIFEIEKIAIQRLLDMKVVELFESSEVATETTEKKTVETPVEVKKTKKGRIKNEENT